MESLKGVVVSITFHNPDNGYTIARLEGDDGLFTAVGHLPTASAGSSLELSGAWVTHSRYGEQFSFTSYKEAEPDSAHSIELFLASGEIRGVGPKTARLIVEKFGEKSLEIIEKEPNKLLCISGIGKAKCSDIAESYAEHKAVADVIMQFQQYGIPISAAKRFYTEYGETAVDLVTENPYRIADDFAGIGFKSADRIAMQLGFAENSPERISAAALFVLSRYAASGNTFVPKRELSEKVVSLTDVMGEEIEDALFSLTIEGEVDVREIDGEDAVFLSYLFLAERLVASDLSRLAQGAPKKLNADSDTLISQTEKRMGIELSAEQKEAVHNSLVGGVNVITGGPGTGKTTIMGAVLDIFSHEGLEMAIAAPTGRAAKRITETSGYPAMTIHRLLEYVHSKDERNMHFGRNRENNLDADVVIVDEASMIDVLLMKALLAAIPDKARLILVGDADQLPPVGPGNVLKDVLESGQIPFTHLSEVYRQSEKSMITVNAHRINRGEELFLNETDSDFYMIKRQGEDILRSMVELCTKRLPNYYTELDPLKDIQILTPIKKGPLGTMSLNKTLQSVLNPPVPGKTEKAWGEILFRVGDKVMQMKNNYSLEWRDGNDASEGEGVFNGDIGYITYIDTEMGTVEVCFDDSKYVTYDYETLKELEHAFAVTVHKSQGSEFPVVILPIFIRIETLTNRNLIYTAVTRGKRLVVLIGSERILMAMVENDQQGGRYSALKSFLQKNDGTIDEGSEIQFGEF
jgi:exodeoxyribonuclease V alpha subunit